MKKYILPFILLAILFSCKSENEVGGNGKGVSNAPSVTVGTDHLSAISVVLKGKANLSKTIATDWVIGFQYSLSSGIMPTNSTEVEAEDADSDYNYTTSLTGLTPGTTYYYRSFIRENGQDTYGETKSFTTKGVDSFLETLEASDITAKSAILNAKVDLSDYSSKLIRMGFKWGQSESASSNTIYFTNNTSGGTEIVDFVDEVFSKSITNLIHDTQYWYKAFVEIDDRRYYADIKSFNTSDISALVSTAEASEVSAFSAVLYGTLVLTTQENMNISKWFIYSDSATTLEELKTCETKIGASWITDNSFSSGLVSNLTPNTKYYYVAVSKIENEEFYGEIKSFRTLDHYAKGEAVDLGLSVKWSNINLGATQPTDFGLFMAWGDPEIKYYSLVYKWGFFSTDSPHGFFITRYCPLDKSEFWGGDGVPDNKTEYKDYEYEDDAARIIWGANWHIPTYAEWKELLDDCTWVWTSSYNGTGISGCIVTSTIAGFEGRSIFLPAAGSLRHYATGYVSEEENCSYWSSSLDESYPLYAHYIVVGHNTDIREFAKDSRIKLGSIRPVCEE